MCKYTNTFLVRVTWITFFVIESVKSILSCQSHWYCLFIFQQIDFLLLNKPNNLLCFQKRIFVKMDKILSTIRIMNSRRKEFFQRIIRLLYKIRIKWYCRIYDWSILVPRAISSLKNPSQYFVHDLIILLQFQ